MIRLLLKHVVHLEVNISITELYKNFKFRNLLYVYVYIYNPAIKVFTFAPTHGDS